MKKILITTGIIFLLIIGLFFVYIIDPIQSSIKEVLIKQEKIRESTTKRVVFNGTGLSDEKSNEVINLIRVINFDTKQGSIKVVGAEKYNNTLEFLNEKNEKIEFRFYFSKKCWNNRVEVKIGMMTAELEKLCEALADEKNE